MNKLILLFIFFGSSQICLGQGGIQFLGGLSQVQNKDVFITPEGKSHHGYFFGADAALNDGKMYLIIGGQYHNLSFMPQDEKAYFSHEESMVWMKLRAGLGFELFQLADQIKLSAKTVGSINILNKYPKDLLPSPYGKFNSGTAGLALGLNLEIFNFGIAAEYEKGFFNAVNKMPGTEFDFLSLALSFRI